jgi:ATP-dependent protease ClpP protease subunit
MQPPQTNVLRNQLAFLNQPTNHAPATKVLLVFSCYGGATDEMRALYDLVRSFSFAIEVHVIGGIKSAAIPFILASDRRTAAPDTSFFFHPWVWSVDAGGHVLNVLEQPKIQLQADIDWGKKVLMARTKLTVADIGGLHLFDKGVVMDAPTALRYGIIHEIVELKIPAGVMTWNIA